MLKNLEQWFFPNVCCLCGMDPYPNTGQDLCAVCKASLPWLEDNCYRCGLPLISGRDSIYCETCGISPPEFDRLCAPFSYQLPVIKLVTRLKFGAQLAYGRVLGELLAESLITKWYQNKPFPEAILPVPLHKSRFRKRGFNQALELLWPLIKRRPAPLLLEHCIRVRNTVPQSALNRDQRIQNLEKSFQITKPIPYQHIAIMDDVVTTGSTVNALSKVLKDAGVAEVDIWCVCRSGS